MLNNESEKTITFTEKEIRKLLVPIVMCIEMVNILQETYEFLDAGLMEVEDVVIKIQDALGYVREGEEGEKEIEEIVEKEEN